MSTNIYKITEAGRKEARSFIKRATGRDATDRDVAQLAIMGALELTFGTVPKWVIDFARVLPDQDSEYVPSNDAYMVAETIGDSDE